MVGLAVHIVRIAMGEIEDAPEDDGEDKAAQSMGWKSSSARAASMTPERRAVIADQPGRPSRSGSSP